MSMTTRGGDSAAMMPAGPNTTCSTPAGSGSIRIAASHPVVQVAGSFAHSPPRDSRGRGAVPAPRCHHQLVTGRDQSGRHRLTHQAEPDETDPHDDPAVEVAASGHVSSDITSDAKWHAEAAESEIQVSSGRTEWHRAGLPSWVYNSQRST